ncbi:hypothetical protein EXIGLDRAFT_773079 [Exidia glandulosa HHB12029]|uniref:Uncharacterized protein n=1 Tax=Exidia glandulosa HHB12029 TaxID=1314781 RepID=A0A165EZ52_EXIGL|nr:hypothetical protein EXIGLDRAFT_773079 [Exidia glandulosa HHB12029]
MTSQNAVPIAMSAICDPAFDILSFRYLRSKDGTIIRYRNFKLRFETLSKRVETFGRRLVSPELTELELDLVTMIEGTPYVYHAIRN